MFDFRQIPGWMTEGTCATIGGDLWFPEGAGSSSAAAKRVCRGCPVRQQCLTYAMDNLIQDGVWGGTTVRQRRRIAKERAAV